MKRSSDTHSDHLQIESLLIGFDLQHLVPELVYVGGVLDGVELLVVDIIITGVTPDRQITEAQGHTVV